MNILNAVICTTLLFSLQTWSASGFDVNDVSFLFPLKNGRPHPLIPLQSEKAKLIETEIFTEILKFEHPDLPLNALPYVGTTFLAQPLNWFITSVRYDDCGESHTTVQIEDPVSKSVIQQTSKIEICQPHLRLVAQPFNSANQPLATAMHLLYQLDHEENAFIIQQLLFIKDLKVGEVRSAGKPLIIHPLLAEEINQQTMIVADQIQNMIVTALTMKQRSPSLRLQTVTMTINTEVMAWKMVGGLVIDQHWNRFVTDYNTKFYDSKNNSVLLGVEVIRCNFYEFCGTLPQNESSTISADNILTPALKALSDGRLVAPVKSPEAQTQAEIIDDPKRTHFFNTNCISCHESANFRNREKLLIAFQGPPEITPFTTQKLLGDRPSTIMNFGYEGMSPQVSVRVAAESALVADRLNKSLNLIGSGAPVQDASSFWACLMKEKFQNCIN